MQVYIVTVVSKLDWPQTIGVFTSEEKADEVTAKVIKLDPEHKKLALSIKEYLIEKNQMNHDDIVMSTKGKKNRKKSADKKSRKNEDEDQDED